MLSLHLSANRIAWGTAATLAVVVLGGIGKLGVWLRAYWVARYRGQSAHLSGALLIAAPLKGVTLCDTALDEANLSGADLRHARFVCALVTDANLSGADLSGAELVNSHF